MPAMDGLRIRLLGELQVARADGRPLPLPASKKTRALLGYLIATGVPQRRERLCDLLWDGPDDPRAELRWSLSKIRPLLNEGKVTRLVADRERVGFDKVDADIDLVSIRALLAAGVAAVPTETLMKAAGMFHGAFLDGLDLPICYRYQEWCIAEREGVSRLHQTVLATIVERLAVVPQDALPYARSLVSVDPLSESAHATVVRLLVRLRRNTEAQGHYEHAKRLFETEVGAPPTNELDEARRAIAARRPPLKPALDDSAEQPARRRPAPAGTAFIGRHTERTLVDSFVAATVARRMSRMVLVTGEPGIGKSHLLAHLGQRMEAAGGAIAAARAFEAEAARPYGIWVDILRAIAAQRPGEPMLRDLGVLLPELGAPTGDLADRTRLFDLIAGLLRRVGAERGLLVALDDIQWIDEASSALLHYAARQNDVPCGLLVACAARTGEIDDNTAVSSVLRSLGRDDRRHEIALTALGPDETAELVRSIDPTLDAGQVFAESGGNPLFALELARARSSGARASGRTLNHVISGQLARLKEPTRELLAWAAALERSFTADRLARVASCDAPALLAALHELERHGLILPDGADSYEFAHDLVRQAAYRAISQPRRRLVHRQIARALDEAAGADPALAADVAHHAALGGDDVLAARACATAGERALRLFANAEARGLAERGLRHVERMPRGAARVDGTIALLSILILATSGPGMRPLPPLVDAVAQATDEAAALGLHAAVSTGHYLLSVLHQEAGDRRRAETSTLRAAEAGRTADAGTRVRQLANTARCLLELETQVARCRHLVREAEAIARPLGIEACELHWASGLLQRWDDKADLAVAAIERALDLARSAEDRWREYKCLTWIAMLEFERARYDRTQARCRELVAGAHRCGEDAAPFVATLQALAGLASAASGSDAAFAAALRDLRVVDDKSWLAYALNAAAACYLRTGDAAAVRAHAVEALAVATLMRRQNDVAIAHALLASIGEAESAAAMERLMPAMGDHDRLSARARAALCIAGATARTAPTVLPTALGQT